MSWHNHGNSSKGSDRKRGLGFHLLVGNQESLYTNPSWVTPKPHFPFRARWGGGEGQGRACQGATQATKAERDHAASQPWGPWGVLASSTHLLMMHFDGYLFLAFMDFCPSPKKVTIQILLKILFALKISFHNFSMLKKWTLRTNQAGSPLSAIYPFLLASLILNTISRRKKCWDAYYPSKIN